MTGVEGETVCFVLAHVVVHISGWISSGTHSYHHHTTGK
jgi:hypothetical protein